MVEIRFYNKFPRVFNKIKDKLLKVKINKQIKKISKNPEVGKSMKNSRKETMELYIKPFKLLCSYNKGLLIIYILDLYHKNK